MKWVYERIEELKRDGETYIGTNDSARIEFQRIALIMQDNEGYADYSFGWDCMTGLMFIVKD